MFRACLEREEVWMCQFKPIHTDLFFCCCCFISVMLIGLIWKQLFPGLAQQKKKKNCVKLEFSQLCCFFNLSVYFCKNICALEKKFFIHSKWKSIRLIRIILKTFIMMFVLLCVDYDEKHCMKLQFVPQFSQMHLALAYFITF